MPTMFPAFGRARARHALPALAAAAFFVLPQPLAAQTDEAVDPQAYAGLWFEIARTPAPFQAACDGGVTAFYEIANDEIRVVNRCDLPDGTVQMVEGVAEPVDESFRELSVDFPASPETPGVDYRIEALGPMTEGQYEWAAVSSPGEIGWILSRTPDIRDEALVLARRALEEAGVDARALLPTAQPPEHYDPQSLP